jgi:hypothetical protein
MQNPLLSVVNPCGETIIKPTREFGLTSEARSRISVKPSEDDGHEELWRILSQPRVNTGVKRRTEPPPMKRIRSQPRHSPQRERLVELILGIRPYGKSVPIKALRLLGKSLCPVSFGQVKIAGA